jgi:hypothetical protein
VFNQIANSEQKICIYLSQGVTYEPYVKLCLVEVAGCLLTTYCEVLKTEHTLKELSKIVNIYLTVLHMTGLSN